MIEAVIFDMDGVLCELDHPARLSYLSMLSGRPGPEIHNAVWGSGFEDRSDTGELSPEEYLAGFGERIGYPLSRAEWVGARKAGTIPIGESLEIVSNLRGMVGLALLTNNGLLLKETMAGVFPQVAELFGAHLYVSAEFGLRKPDPSVFLRTCEALGSKPAKTLMIDDRDDNILGALTAGLQGYHYRSGKELSEYLAGLIV